MSIAETLLPEFEQEMASTRKTLERVPSDKGRWKPHPKSFPMAHLAQLVAWMGGWVGQALRETSLDLAQAGGYTYETTETLLRIFDKGVQESRDALKAAKDADFGVTWSLKHGDRVLFSGPRSVIVRNTISHLIHHRAQLGVYLRLNDVPVPAIYGPTADEKAW
jgi:uncharacterized damage-inducible protein DinB